MQLDYFPVLTFFLATLVIMLFGATLDLLNGLPCSDCLALSSPRELDVHFP